MSNAYLLGSATEPSIGKLGGFQAFNRALSVDEMTRMLAAGIDAEDRGATVVDRLSDRNGNFEAWNSSSSPASWALGGSISSSVQQVTVDPISGTSSLRFIGTGSPGASFNNTIFQSGRFTSADVGKRFRASMKVKMLQPGTLYIGQGSNSFQSFGAANFTPGKVTKVSRDWIVETVAGNAHQCVIAALAGAEFIIDDYRIEQVGQTADFQPGGLQMAPGQWIEVVHGKHGTIPDGMILGDYVPPPEGPEISAVDVVNKDSAVRGLISGRRADLIAKKYRSGDAELGGAEPSDELMPTQAAVQAFWQSKQEEISAEHVQDADSDDLGLISGRRADLIAKKYRSADVELGGAEPSNELMPTQAAVQEFLQSKIPVYSTRITESGTWVRPPKCSLFLVYMANGGNSGSAYASTAAGSAGSGGAGGAAFMFAVRAEDLPDEVPVVIGAGAPPSVAAVPSNGNASLNGTIGGTTYFNGKGLPNGGTYGWSGWLPTSANLPVSGLFAGNGAQSSSVAGNAVWGGAGGGATSSGSSPVRPPGVSLAGGDGGVSAEEQAPSADVVAGAGEFPAGGGAGARISFGTQGQRAISGKGGDGVIDIWGYE